MKIRGFEIVVKALVLLSLLVSINVQGQTKWSGVWGNEWLEGKYTQEWLKISVSQKGIFKVTLSGNFKNKPDKLHLYHRGVEVALISATNDDITFYGVPNNGKSDELLYRSSLHVKDPTARDNPYWSIYGDISAYFLTFDANNGVRASTSNLSINESVTSEPYHLQSAVSVFTNQFSHSASLNVTTVFNVQSFFESGRGLTGELYGKHATATIAAIKGDLTLNHQLRNLYISSEVKPKVEILLYGRNTANNDIAVFVGKNDGSTRNINSNFNFWGFTGSKKEFNLNTSNNADDSDLTSTGQGIVKLVSQNVTSSWTTTGIFSCTYVKYVYPQTFDMTTQTAEFFNLTPTVNAQSRMTVLNTPANAKVYDITDSDVPVILTGVYAGATLNVMVPRQSNKETNLMISSDEAVDLTSKSEAVTFTSYNRANYDFLMVSTKKLMTKDVGTPAVTLYKQYRESAAGGSMRPLLVDVVDLYNQFNYGEPSPVAIRRFVDFMISPEKRTKHNLLLIGHSVTTGDKLKLTGTFRELVDEVPTIGYPGSDNLLVEGLRGASQDVPAIPVGRISATNDAQVNNYLEKLKTYEADKLALSWRKTGLHVNGGIYDGESNAWSTTYYKGRLNGVVTSEPFYGTVIEKQKPVNEPSNMYPLDIKSEINSGVGFMTYFGHGNPHYTDYNMGYMSDTRKGYTNTGKYPIMYFNGCGVGNIFKGALLDYPNNNGDDKTMSEDVLPISIDWLLAPQKGAIAIIGNSYYAFESSSKDYLYALYDQIFEKDDASRATIGQIHRATASMIITGSANGRTLAVDSYALANTHQSNLQGDPALPVLKTTTSALPVGLYAFKASANSEGEALLTWKTAWEKNNSGFYIERSGDARQFSEIGRVDGKGNSDKESSYSFVDKEPLSGLNYYRLRQVDILDPAGSEKSEYSRIIAVNFDELSNIEVYPSPVIDELSIRMDNPDKLKSWILRDISGRELTSGSGTKISMRKLPSSLYIVELISANGQSQFKKIVK